MYLTKFILKLFFVTILVSTLAAEGAAYEPPSAPKGPLKVIIIGPDSMQLSWGEPEGIDKTLKVIYKLEMMEDPTNEWTAAADLIPIRELHYTLSHLKPRTKYKFRVKAVLGQDGPESEFLETDTFYEIKDDRSYKPETMTESENQWTEAPGFKLIDEIKYTLPGLEPKTKYKYSVKGEQGQDGPEYEFFESDTFYETKVKRDFKYVTLNCKKDKPFNYECNSCTCNKDGDAAVCTLEEDCKENDKGGWTGRLDVVCNPSEKFRNACNKCECSEDGNGAVCQTTNDCDEDFRSSCYYRGCCIVC